MEKTQSTMTVATAGATESGRRETTGELIEKLQAGLGQRSADLCLIFASAHFEDELETIAGGIQERLAPRAFIGVSGETIVYDDTEYENQPAISVWAAHLPGVGHTSFHFSQEDLQRLTERESLRDHLGVPVDEEPYFILLGDPFSINPLELLDRLHAAYPGRPTIGGMASAGEGPEQNTLVFEGQVLAHGLVGVALWGNLEIETIVSQGCRPIGRHMVITKGERNIIHSLGGRPPLTVVNELLTECSPRDRKLVQQGLLIGRVINEYQPQFTRGDFLIRNPLGFDANTGALAIGDFVRTGQTIQFHVRDAQTATEDLETLLGRCGERPAAGALLFDCNGRGMRLFPQRSHDARLIRAGCGHIPLAGFFCAGEFGPIGARNFLHGHTASIGLFRPAADNAGA